MHRDAVIVVRAGLHTTVQDGGRFGYEHQGVPPSGPMDSIAHRIANLLVGNPANAAALEMTALGGSFAVVGGECNVCVSGRAVLLVDSPGEAQRELECWRTHRLAAGSVLDWWLARRIAASPMPRVRRAWLLLSLSTNLGVLALFKYGGFLHANVAWLLGGVGVTLKDRRGKTVAAVSVTFQVAAWPRTTVVEKLVPALVDTAQTLRSIL